MDFVVASKAWLIAGLVLMFLEVLFPGLISVFIGLGAVTVAVLIHTGHISDVTEQLLVWFVSSIVYIFTLRAFFLRFFPQAHQKQLIDEDELIYGKIVSVVEDIPAEGVGRIAYSDSTWPAKSVDSKPLTKGSKVCIQGRENITYLVTEVIGEKK